MVTDKDVETALDNQYDGVDSFLLVQEILELQAENKQLKEDLIEFGRHSAGCPNQYDKKYPCKCGWLKTEQALKGG